MKKTSIIVLTIFLIIIVLIEGSSEKKFSWEETYYRYDKNPFGTYILDNQIHRFFPDHELEFNDQSIFEYLSKNSYSYTKFRKNQNMIIINTDFYPDDESETELLDWVSRGNNAFISARTFKYSFADTLKFRARGNYSFYFSENPFSKDFKYDYVKLSDDRYSRRSYPFPSFLKSYFTKFDTTRNVVLGKYTSGETNFIKIRMGKGHFYIHLLPSAFTNYFLIKERTTDYAEKTLSNLEDSYTIRDMYFNNFPEDTKNDFYFFFQHKELKWAFYTGLIGFLFYIIFNFKRELQVIPLKVERKNTALEFANTLTALFLNTSKHKKIAEKKIKHLLAYLRHQYHLTITNYSPDTIKKISYKTGISIDELNEFFAFIKLVEKEQELSSELLKELNNKIEAFYKKVKNG